MKMHWLAMAALPLLAAPGVPGLVEGGEGSSTSKGRLARVADGEDQFDREAWRKRLTTNDLEERERACDELGDLARQVGEARKALKEWSREESDRELAWTARMLLREVDRDPLRPLRARGRAGKDGFGRSFDFDDFSRRFQDLDSLFGDLRSEWSEMLETLPAPSAGSTSSSQSMSLQVGPDEVSCTVTENVDGKEQKRTFTAKTMDELLQAHPELREHLGGTNFRFFHGLPNGSWRSFPQGGGTALSPGVYTLDPRDVTAQGEPPTDRLGIYCGDLDEDRVSELGLEAGVGLSVVEVQPGTIASLLGLRAGDVVIEVDGRTIRGTEDVKEALKARAADASVSVVVAGEDGDRRTLTWKPKAKAGKKTGSRDP